MSASSLRVPGGSLFPPSNLSEYRALQQVVAHASVSGCSAEQIVRDALVGGVLTAYHDQYCRSVNHVFLPSVKCLPLLSELAAEGFFSPLLSTVAECEWQARLTPRCETGIESLFTVVTLLFADCFLDGAVCSLPMTPPVSPREQSFSNAEASGTTTSRQPSLNPPSTAGPSRAATMSAVSEPLADTITSLQDAVTSREESGSRPQDAVVSGSTANGIPSAGAPRQRVDGSPVPFLAGPSLALTEDHAAVAEAVSTASVPVDLLTLHRERVTVALVVFATLNDTLHALQMRQLLPRSSSPKPSPDQPNSDSALAAAENATIDAVVSCVLQFKLLLLSCLIATETSYMPNCAKAWENPLAPTDSTVTQTDASRREAHTSDSTPSFHLLRLYPRTALEALLREEAAHASLSPAATTTLSRENASGQFDTVVDQLEQAYQALPYRSHANLSSWMGSLKQSALDATRAELTHAPVVTLLRPADGVPAALISSLACADVRRAKLPTMPLQSGELFLYAAARPATLLAIDCTTSPLAAIVTLGTTVKLTDVQIRDEVEPYLATHAWNTTPLRARLVLEQISKDRVELARLLDKNAVVLARLVAWVRPPASASPDASATAIVERINAFTLFEAPFTVSVGQYLRELLNREAVSLSTVERWLQHNAETPVAANLMKMISVIADFAAVHSHWEYNEGAVAALSRIKARAV